MELVRLQFYLKCTECGSIARGEPDGEWTVYPVACEKCERKLIPEVRIDQKEKAEVPETPAAAPG